MSVKYLSMSCRDNCSSVCTKPACFLVLMLSSYFRTIPLHQWVFLKHVYKTLFSCLWAESFTNSLWSGVKLQHFVFIPPGLSAVKVLKSMLSMNASYCSSWTVLIHCLSEVCLQSQDHNFSKYKLHHIYLIWLVLVSRCYLEIRLKKSIWHVHPVLTTHVVCVLDIHWSVDVCLSSACCQLVVVFLFEWRKWMEKLIWLKWFPL